MPAREQPIAGVSGRQVADAAVQAGADARFEPTRAEVGQAGLHALRPGDVVLTLGAGDITRVGSRAGAVAERRLTSRWPRVRYRQLLALLLVAVWSP